MEVCLRLLLQKNAEEKCEVEPMRQFSSNWRSKWPLLSSPQNGCRTRHNEPWSKTQTSLFNFTDIFFWRLISMRTSWDMKCSSLSFIPSPMLSCSLYSAVMRQEATKHLCSLPEVVFFNWTSSWSFVPRKHHAYFLFVWREQNLLVQRGIEFALSHVGECIRSPPCRVFSQTTNTPCSWFFCVNPGGMSLQIIGIYSGESKSNL